MNIQCHQIPKKYIGKTYNLYQEADGTRYDIIAIELPKGISFGHNYLSQPAYLIISGYDKTAYAFSQNEPQSIDYIAEKLTKHYNKTDAKHLLELINHLKQQRQAEGDKGSHPSKQQEGKQKRSAEKK